MKHIILSILIFLTASMAVNAQTTRQEVKAKKAFSIFNFKETIKLTEEIGGGDFEMKRKQALSHFNLREYAQAEHLLLELQKSDQFSSDDLFTLILTLLYNEKYVQADQQMAKFAQQNPSDVRSNIFLYDRDNLSEMLSVDPAITLQTLNFNNGEIDFGAAYNDDQLVFASSRKKWLLAKRDYVWNSRPFLNLYTAIIGDDQQLGKPKRFRFNQNKKWHESSASFAKGGSLMAFTQNNYKQKSSDATTNLQIFFVERTNSGWSAPIPFYLNNPEYSVGHPSLSEDGNVMYFASDMPGGFGGVDLYQVEKDAEGAWGQPVNLGVEINTEANEMFPFWNEQNQLLYFSSNGKYGMGGLDIYESRYMGNNVYSPAYNLGAPINSSADDFAFAAKGDLTSGFFSSNRSSGQGDDDIYAFQNSDPNPVVYNPVQVSVLDKATGKPVPNASLFVNNESHVVPADGAVSITLTTGNYPLNAEAIAYQQSAPKSINMIATRKARLLRDTVFMDLKVAEKLVLNNIYYDFDMWNILPEAAAELDKIVNLMNENSGLKIELSSHTDARGSHRYNDKLSELRAQSAKKYLVDKGIDASRIAAKGYGKRQLINNCTDCTPADHRQNRRTEIYIPEFGRGEDVKQDKGDYSDGTPDVSPNYSSSKKHGSIYSIRVF